MSPKAESATGSWLLAHPLLLAVLAAAVSVGLQGFAFGINNNVFHIPIVLGYGQLGQFAGDPFIQSLGRFVSPVYLALGLVADERNIQGLFLACHVLTRVLTFLALILIVTASGVRGGWRLLLAVAALVLARGLYGVSPMGEGGMLPDYFTHSELSGAFALLTVAALLRGRLVLAAGLAGIAFALNAFIGVWMLVPVGLGLLAPWAGWDGPRPQPRPWLRQLLLAALAFSVPALPVAVWVLRSTAGDAAVAPFDYREYLYFYFGKHFFMQASSTREILQSGTAVLAGLAALLVLPNWRRALLPLAGLLLVLGAGAVAGIFANSRFILNLHLIRADSLLIMLSGAYVAAATARLAQPAWNWRGIAALLSLAGLLSGLWALSAVALANAWLAGARAAAPGAPAGRAIPALCLALLAAAAILNGAALRKELAADAIPREADLEGMMPRAPEWLEMQLWARQNTPAEARFLVPSWPSGFRIGAQRSVWVDFKQGATAMWAPDTYAGWRQRVDEINRLRSLPERCAYARTRGLDYVIIDLRPGRAPALEGSPAVPLHANRLFRAYAAASC
ncbi:DUF6798 domain-containing protein [Roseomonas marmotae]|uniref:DUF6798 domain-containing protein n=1 Tax=Roseomonas marmotae TaxID=2768161 RepID=A0ABS3KDD8_9PROT|nr:DUF6798 domain-containing protein [Roseomonas marmotae]MBO1075473.1 hypothetical protein [Roseomonas marmotae]QTI81422.1 hypothetical protein IAI58_18910 [Roseomonas marmotae]